MKNRNGLDISPEFISRQQKLNAWLVERGITYQKVADATGLSLGFVGKIFSGKKTPKKRIDQLINMGIPAELLPEPKPPCKRGPKPKHDSNTTYEKAGGEG